MGRLLNQEETSTPSGDGVGKCVLQKDTKADFKKSNFFGERKDFSKCRCAMVIRRFRGEAAGLVAAAVAAGQIFFETAQRHG